MRVTDNGSGIPDDVLPKIFEPFYTTKPVGEGTGLGLSTAYGIIKQTGGFIFVDSQVGVGTVFTILIPIYTGAEEASPPPPEREIPNARSGKTGTGVVLLVEDEAPVRAFATRALRLRGYTVLEADHAEAALQMLEDMTVDVDLFVTDVIMPGMDGPTWVQQALETRPETKTIFVSGYAEDALNGQVTRTPNSVFLPKPFSLTDLTDLVFEQLADEEAMNFKHREADAPPPSAMSGTG